jgi:hypothetical protein
MREKGHPVPSGTGASDGRSTSETMLRHAHRLGEILDRVFKRPKLSVHLVHPAGEFQVWTDWALLGLLGDQDDLADVAPLGDEPVRVGRLVE